MWTAALVICGSLSVSGGEICYIADDMWGPYEDREKCTQRLVELVDGSREILELRGFSGIYIKSERCEIANSRGA